MDIFRKHFEKIKEIFIMATNASLSPPDFKKDAFYKFCSQARIPSGRLNRGIIDTLFKATNFEIGDDDDDQNDDNALIRFEFLEIFVRIAQCKYIEFGKMNITISQAVSRLLQNHILPMHQKFTPWQSWRTNELYCYQVSDLLEINQRSLQ